MSGAASDGAAARGDGDSGRPAKDPVERFGLLESKLSPPQIRDGSVPRRKLLELLQGSRATPVILLSSGPGYGKTTLLSQWEAESRRSFAWVTLDEHDNDPIVLMSYMAAALDRVARLDPVVFDSLASGEAAAESAVVSRIGSAMGTLEPSFVLVLEDIHAITNPQCLDAVEVLVDHLPEGSQLALSGRRQPDRRIGSLRTRGLLLEIGPDRLRMEAREAQALLGAAGVHPSETELGELIRRTEGWPAGLYLAALSVSLGGSGTGPVAEFRGDNRFLAEYLNPELLDRLPPATLRFLTRTSVLDRMCGSLCDAVLGSTGSARTLEALHRDNLFVVALDQHRQWYRYHGLFRELLRAELERSEHPAAAELLARACAWCAANGQPKEAIGYAQAAGDVDRVAELVLGQAQIEYAAGRAVTVEAWLEWLERHGGLGRNAMIAAFGSWFYALRGRPGEAERWADAAGRDSQEPSGTGDGALPQAFLAVLHAMRCRQGLERMRADAELAMEGFGRASPLWPTAALPLATAYWLGGDPRRADDLFSEIAESAAAVTATNAHALALAERALIAMDRGDWGEAEARSDEANSTVRAARIENYPPNALVHIASARIAIHRGDQAAADEMLVRAQRLRPLLTRALGAFAVQARIELARAYAARADVAGARTVLREAEGLMARGGDFGLLASDAASLRTGLESAIDTPGASTLTGAELRLLPLLLTHLSFREIGERLHLSRHTIKSQAMSIYRKLDVTSRGAAVERARSLGLL